jgi:hypothetical protein
VTTQSHSLSQARLAFLVVLVVFFCLLFVGVYVWMRRPNFGQEKSLSSVAAHGTKVTRSEEHPSEGSPNSEEVPPGLTSPIGRLTKV